jgi:hypothetical protein
MKKLKVGDQFHAMAHDGDPYTVLEVHDRHYIVKQQSSSASDNHSVEVIHDLFRGSNPWILSRKKTIHFNEELFTL